MNNLILSISKHHFGDPIVEKVWLAKMEGLSQINEWTEMTAAAVASGLCLTMNLTFSQFDHIFQVIFFIKT